MVITLDHTHWLHYLPSHQSERERERERVSVLCGVCVCVCVCVSDVCQLPGRSSLDSRGDWVQWFRVSVCLNACECYTRPPSPGLLDVPLRERERESIA